MSSSTAFALSLVSLAAALSGCGPIPAKPTSVANRPDQVAKPPGPRLITLVSLPAGDYVSWYGKTSVHVNAFKLQASEVTVADYDVCVALGNCTPAGRGGLCNADVKGHEEHPVNCVTWNQATVYCASLGQRLPTDDEWEWAARQGAKMTMFPWGDMPPGTDQGCWGRPTDGTCPVGSFPKGDTPSGIHDLGGNVWEYTSTVGTTPDKRWLRGGDYTTDGTVVGMRGRREVVWDSKAPMAGLRCAK